MMVAWELGRSVMEKILMRPTEVAQMLSIGKSTIYELLATGDIRSIRIGRSIRIPVKWLNEWVEKQEGGEIEDVTLKVGYDEWAKKS